MAIERMDTKHRKKHNIAENIADLERLSDQIGEAELSFALTELDIAMTFCSIVASTNDTASKKRNIENARRGYEIALRILQRKRINLKNHHEHREKLEALKKRLRQLHVLTD